MKRFAFFVVASIAMMLVACSSGGVAGTYKIDTSSVKDYDKMPQNAKDMLSKISVTLNGDKTFTSIDPQGKEEKGTWEQKDKTITFTSAGKSFEVTVEADGRLKANNMGIEMYFKK